MPRAFTQEEVIEFIENEENYKVESIDYKNQKSKIYIKHLSCGNIFITDFTHWKDRNQRCPICNKESQKKTHEQFVNDVEKYQPNRYSILGKYVNKKTKVNIKCNICNTELEMLPCNIFTGQCMGCRNILNSNRYRKTIEEVNKTMPDGYTVIGEYKNNKTPTKIRHSCGTEFIASVTNIRLKKKSQKCPKCFSNKSAAEVELYEFIKSICPSKANHRVHDKINKHKFKEIDILTDSNIGFEFDGLYWHSTDRHEKYNLLEKTNFFKEIGIPIIHIFEDEWNFNKNHIKTIISDIIKNKTQYILNNKNQLVPFDNSLETIVVDLRWLINEEQILKDYELIDEILPKEFFLDSKCDIRLNENSDDIKFSIFDCGYKVYKKIKE